jgi:hypothetical protein
MYYRQGIIFVLWECIFEFFEDKNYEKKKDSINW